jgi:hypothetical protein
MVNIQIVNVALGSSNGNATLINSGALSSVNRKSEKTDMYDILRRKIASRNLSDCIGRQ